MGVSSGAVKSTHSRHARRIIIIYPHKHTSTLSRKALASTTTSRAERCDTLSHPSEPLAPCHLSHASTKRSLAPIDSQPHPQPQEAGPNLKPNDDAVKEAHKHENIAEQHKNIAEQHKNIAEKHKHIVEKLKKIAKKPFHHDTTVTKPHEQEPQQPIGTRPLPVPHQPLEPIPHHPEPAAPAAAKSTVIVPSNLPPQADSKLPAKVSEESTPPVKSNDVPATAAPTEKTPASTKSTVVVIANLPPQSDTKIPAKAGPESTTSAKPLLGAASPAAPTEKNSAPIKSTVAVPVIPLAPDSKLSAQTGLESTSSAGFGHVSAAAAPTETTEPSTDGGVPSKAPLSPDADTQSPNALSAKPSPPLISATQASFVNPTNVTNATHPTNVTVGNSLQANLNGSSLGATSPNVSSRPNSNHTAAAVGGLFGCLAVIALIAGGYFVIFNLITRRRLAKKKEGSNRGSLTSTIPNPLSEKTMIEANSTLPTKSFDGPTATLEPPMSPDDPVTRFSVGGVTLLNRLQGLTESLNRTATPASPSDASDDGEPDESTTMNEEPDALPSTSVDEADADSHQITTANQTIVSPSGIEGEDSRRSLLRADSDNSDTGDDINRGSGSTDMSSSGGLSSGYQETVKFEDGSEQMHTEHTQDTREQTWWGTQQSGDK
ncbi:hypothetical protein PSTG_08926 [Puccinia striiformis f. sp. tritici PST-78]|uniref:Uncharacterized protein n=1 Tax=Puccinia striiformis f. sp. tritici PST-78 TaxID=1165861 RepID=A0A0L0VFB3_9BASI|nr:hypothetical protein PSTG_08926 [Puccinia striiformis f. sp. tritici PST-78]